MRFITVPTARAALGCPTLSASVPYGGRDPVRDAGQLGQHLGVERCHPQIERQVELAAAALEVLVELAPDVVDRAAQHAAPEHARQLVLLAFRVEVDASEAAVGRGDQQLADGRVDDVVADVDDALRGWRPRGTVRRAQA